MNIGQWDADRLTTLQFKRNGGWNDDARIKSGQQMEEVRLKLGEVSQTASRALAIVEQLLFGQVESVHSVLGQSTEEKRLWHAG